MSLGFGHDDGGCGVGDDDYDDDYVAADNDNNENDDVDDSVDNYYDGRRWRR